MVVTPKTKGAPGKKRPLNGLTFVGDGVPVPSTYTVPPPALSMGSTSLRFFLRVPIGISLVHPLPGQTMVSCTPFCRSSRVRCLVVVPTSVETRAPHLGQFTS